MVLTLCANFTTIPMIAHRGPEISDKNMKWHIRSCGLVWETEEWKSAFACGLIMIDEIDRTIAWMAVIDCSSSTDSMEREARA